MLTYGQRCDDDPSTGGKGKHFPVITVSSNECMMNVCCMKAFSITSTYKPDSYI